MDEKSILEQIKALPKGNITTKTIHGKPYEYWQYTKDGKQVSRRVKGKAKNSRF